MSVMLVDDSRKSRQLLRLFLEQDGFEDVVPLDAGKTALQHVDEEGAAGLDVVLLDLMMPEMDGIETCRRLKTRSALEDVPVIMVTGSDDETKLEEAFEAGAFDYMHKPVERTELGARVRSAMAYHEELRRRRRRERELVSTKEKLEDANERLRELSRELEAERNQLHQNLHLAAAAQSLLLPRERTLRGERVAIAGEYEPATECAGDWWWRDLRDDGRAVIVIGDVSGHGADAAMISASLAGSLEALVNESEIDFEDVPRLLRALKEQTRGLTRGPFSVTLSVAVVDPEAETLDWWTAGAPPMLLLDRSVSEEAPERFQYLNARSSRLGTDHEVSIGHERRSIDEGMRMLLFTDGLFESPVPNGNQIGMGRVAEFLEETADCDDVEESVDRIAGRFREVVDPGSRTDDVTLVAVDYVES